MVEHKNEPLKPLWLTYGVEGNTVDALNPQLAKISTLQSAKQVPTVPQKYVEAMRKSNLNKTVIYWLGGAALTLVFLFSLLLISYEILI